ncbi:MAG: type II toxin-antitoxin system RelE/ParE family toxin [Gemmatimonadota bacterium]
MILSFKGRGTGDVFDGGDTKTARGNCPRELWDVAARKLELLDSAQDLRDLRIPPGNRLEKLRGERRGMHSIRINDRYRIRFEWTGTGPRDVETVDYH